MKRSFQISVGSKLSTDEYSTMVDKLAELLPSVNENVHIPVDKSQSYPFCYVLVLFLVDLKKHEVLSSSDQTRE